MFEVNNKDTKSTLLWYLYCSLWTYFTPFSNVSIIHFEQVFAGKVKSVKFEQIQIMIAFQIQMQIKKR